MAKRDEYNNKIEAKVTINYIGLITFFILPNHHQYSVKSFDWFREKEGIKSSHLIELNRHN